jgi:hypothetical protein
MRSTPTRHRTAAGLGRLVAGAARPLRAAVVHGGSALARAFRRAAEHVPTSVLDAFPGR